MGEQSVARSWPIKVSLLPGQAQAQAFERHTPVLDG